MALYFLNNILLRRFFGIGKTLPLPAILARCTPEVAVEMTP